MGVLYETAIAGLPTLEMDHSRLRLTGLPRHVRVFLQVFERRHDEPFHALWRPASKKRECTKSWEVWHWRCSGGLWGFDGGAEFEGGCNTDWMRPADQRTGEIASV
jgi:hypothetical protein